MTKIYIANNAASLQSLRPTHSIEAEFGNDVVEGRHVTLAHHGNRFRNPCPCMEENHHKTTGMVIAIAHVDLDCIGGIMAVMGCKPYVPYFWRLAAAIDVRGLHRLPTIKKEMLDNCVDVTFGMTLNSSITRHNELNCRRDLEAAEEMLNAYYAFSEAHRVYAPRAVEGDPDSLKPVDVTDAVMAHVNAVAAILAGDEDLLAAGRVWLAEKEKLDEESLVKTDGGVVLRSSDKFTNILYRQGCCVVAFTPRKGANDAVTISLADPIEGIDCGQVVKGLWGPGAGGKDVIGGSPYDRNMTMADAEEAFAKMVELLSNR
jgi:hypothetical protein